MTTLKKLLPVVLFLTLLSGTAYAQPKIATVDLGRVFTNYWKTKQADAALQARRTELAETDKELIDAYQKLNQELVTLRADANNQAVSAEERQRRGGAVEKKQAEAQAAAERVRQFEVQAKETLTTQSMRMRDNILGEIRATINARAKAGNYTLVLDTAAQSAANTPIILYSTGDSDLTEQVLSQLKASEPVAIPTVDPPKKP